MEDWNLIVFFSLFFFLDSVVICIDCELPVDIFERGRHTAKRCRKLLRKRKNEIDYCNKHPQIPLVQGGICKECRPNLNIHGIGCCQAVSLPLDFRIPIIIKIRGGEC